MLDDTRPSRRRRLSRQGLAGDFPHLRIGIVLKLCEHRRGFSAADQGEEMGDVNAIPG
jgi:hypothetical protein